MWKTKLLRLLGDNISEYLCILDTGKNSLNKTHKAQTEKENIYKFNNINTENSIIKRYHMEMDRPEGRQKAGRKYLQYLYLPNIWRISTN